MKIELKSFVPAGLKYECFYVLANGVPYLGLNRKPRVFFNRAEAELFMNKLLGVRYD